SGTWAASRSSPRATTRTSTCGPTTDGASPSIARFRSSSSGPTRAGPARSRASYANGRSKQETHMVKGFDHCTVVVRDLERAKTFFSPLGFAEDQAVVISGPVVEAYMGVPGIEADHVTLVLAGATPRLEVQLLRYRHPDPLPDPGIERLEKLGFNHIAFTVADVDAEVARLRARGVELRNQVMDFHSRKLVFLKGPEGVTVELVQWTE